MLKANQTMSDKNKEKIKLRQMGNRQSDINCPQTDPETELFCFQLTDRT